MTFLGNLKSSFVNSIGHVKRFGNTVGHFLIEHHEPISAAMTVTGAALIGSGVGAPLGAGLIAGGDALAVMGTTHDVATGRKSVGQAALGLGVGLATGGVLKGVGMRAGGRAAQLARGVGGAVGKT